MRKMAVLLSTLTLCGAVRADLLQLEDDNIIEVKIIGAVKRPNPLGRGVDIDCWEVEDEKGEHKFFDKKTIKSYEMCKTSWEKRAESKKWYEAAEPKAPKTWQGQFNLARDCKSHELYEEALIHYKSAYELREAMPLEAGETDEQRHQKLATFLEIECGMFELAVNENAKVYEHKKEKPLTSVQDFRNLIAWCSAHNLDAEAEQTYKAATARFPDDKALVKAFAEFRNAQAIPINLEMYHELQPTLEAAVKYIKKNEFINADGSMGKDAVEAGVQAIRGMTAISAEALLADWDLQYFKDPVAAGKPPKQVLDAIDFLNTGKKGTGPFYGDDLWGPALSLQFFIRCYTRPYLTDRQADFKKGMDQSIADLAKLQRQDGGWNYYGKMVVPSDTSCSFLSATILTNLIAAKNIGMSVDGSMIQRARDFLGTTKFGEGTYKYSAEPSFEKEGKKGTSFSPVGASARSPLCELACLSAGAGNPNCLDKAIQNFITFQPILGKLRNGAQAARTHTGQGRTAPYYFMFGHYWTARCTRHARRDMQTMYQQYMKVYIKGAADPDGTFKDFTGTKAYRLYATALGVLAMHELITKEPDVAFVAPKAPKADFVTTISTGDVSPSDTLKTPEKSEKK